MDEREAEGPASETEELPENPDRTESPEAVDSNEQELESKIDDEATTEVTPQADTSSTNQEKKVTQPKSILSTKDEEASNQVHAKLVQSHYSTHAKSSLPHILVEYGMPDKDKDKKTVTIDKNKRRRRSRKSVDDESENEDDDKARRRASELKFRQSYGDSRVTSSYYAEYIDFLHEKVAKQRQDMKDKEEAEKQAAIKALEEKSRYKFVRKLERIELKHDSAFMRDLHKTDIARIVRLQDQLMKEGKLRTQGDMDRFWSDIRKPDVFFEHFKTDKSDQGTFEPLVHENYNRNSLDRAERGGGAKPRPLSHISESTPPEDDHWAITQKFSTSHAATSPERPTNNSAQTAKAAAMDLDRRCPKLEIPDLTCFNLRLGEKQLDPEEVQKKLEIKSREKLRKKTTRKLRKMYQMAMTNTAAANRILDQHNDLTDIMNGAALRDIRDFCCGGRKVGHHVNFIAVEDPMIEQHRSMVEYDMYSQASIASSRRSSLSGSGGRLPPIEDSLDTTKQSGKSGKRKKKKEVPAIEEAPPPLPLSYDEVFTREKTMEAKCMSTFWTNYADAGKSAFVS